MKLSLAKSIFLCSVAAVAASGQTCFNGACTGWIGGSGSFFSSGTTASTITLATPSMCSLCGITVGNGIPEEIRKAATVKPISLVEVKTSAKRVALSRLASGSYLELAKSIGLKSPAIDEAQMLSLIHRKGYVLYDYANVDNYLYHQALKMAVNTRWVWEPLREDDLKAAQPYATWTVRSGMGFVYPKVYPLAVPERVLSKVAEIIEDKEIPDVIFLISHYEVIKPDPFLAVTTPKLLDQGKIFIIDQWSEPGFSDPADTIQTASR